MSKWEEFCKEELFNVNVVGFDGVPKEVWYDLLYEINKYELENADNLRAYRLKDNAYRSVYNKREQQGCCGFFETWTKTRSGETWIIGCNYGH